MRFGLATLAVGLIAATLAGQASGQSAVDNATARKLATDAIDLFRAGDVAGALDRMERAQSLFDAPIHLLYIARFQAQLNKLVEAAEGYRRLIRVELSAQAPQAFRDAVADAQKELAELDPKIPMLRLEVGPVGVKDYKISIDGEGVSSAIVGVNRPINPGKHTIIVEGTGGLAARQEVDIAVGARQVVALKLVPREAGAVSGTPAQGAGSGPAAVGAGSGGDVAATAEPANAADAGAGSPGQPNGRRIRLFAGLELGGAVLAGTLDKQTGLGEADNRKASERFGPAFGGELSAGVSFPVGAFNLSPVLFGGYRIHGAGPFLEKSVDDSYGLTVPGVGAVATLEASPSSALFGLAARFDTAPKPLKFGGFAELGLIAKASYWIDATYQRPIDDVKCTFTESFSGSGVRLAGGVLLPASRWFTLEGRLGWSLMKMSQYGIETDCPADELTEIPAADIKSGDRANHSVISLGLGGEFGFAL